MKIHDWENLWSQAAPGSKGDNEQDQPAIRMVRPKKASGAAMLICPGGGYEHLAEHEGLPVAEWLAKQGITAFELRYRLTPYRHPVPLKDAQRALRFIRSMADELKLNKEKIGILGFSAGGHLACSAATHFKPAKADKPDPIERESSQVNLQVLVYPVITFDGEHADYGSRGNLLGSKPKEKLFAQLSLEKHVGPHTPPAFLVHPVSDSVVPVENSDMYVDALKNAKVPFEYVRLTDGEHGFGLQDSWTVDCERWLKKQGFGV